jgi:4,5-DOPA dioxygenase extradiol
MIKTLLKKNQSEALINYKELGDDVQLAIPSPEHYIPLLYIQALRNDTDQLSFFNDKIELGSLSMTSFIFK